MLVFTRYIARHELSPLNRFLSIDDLLEGARKVKDGLGIVPVLIRLKKDKIFGMNISISNSAVTIQINKNLNRIFEDIQKKDYEEFSLST